MDTTTSLPTRCEAVILLGKIEGQARGLGAALYFLVLSSLFGALAEEWLLIAAVLLVASAVAFKRARLMHRVKWLEGRLGPQEELREGVLV